MQIEGECLQGRETDKTNGPACQQRCGDRQPAAYGVKPKHQRVGGVSPMSGAVRTAGGVAAGGAGGRLVRRWRVIR